MRKNELDADDDGIERYELMGVDGDVFAVATYIPEQTPSERFSGWVVDFQNGDRVTGDAGDEVSRLLMNEADGYDRKTRLDWPQNDGQANAILDSVVYDDDSGQYRVTVRGTRVWFQDAADSGDDVVLYQGRDQERRAGVIEDAPFDAARLVDQTKMARRDVDARPDN